MFNQILAAGAALSVAVLFGHLAYTSWREVKEHEEKIAQQEKA